MENSTLNIYSTSQQKLSENDCGVLKHEGNTKKRKSKYVQHDKSDMYTIEKI